ncbi:amidohydrolase family protein [Rubrivirga sp.]|uniref:amidohydrolase family protein n=1 Tax=Rubrivirga sp. TaxID=1885344 RepID=UPI003B521DED
MRLPLLALLFAAAASAQPAPRLTPAAGPTAYVGGMWWTGERFEPRDTTWAEHGVFVNGPLAELARVVDMGGTFVVPPFGDAHYHGFDDPASLATQDSAFVADGVFYVQNPSVIASKRDRVRGLATTVDVTYAPGAITAPGAHPVPVYERQALGLPIDALWDERAETLRSSRRLDGDAYHLALTLDSLDAVWPRVLASGPDLVKVMLGHSEEWAEGTPERPRGLSPEVVAEVVRRAHAAGLRVVAHVETAADVRAALDAGVDAFAHAPGYNAGGGAPASAHVMSDALVADLAARAVPVTPTLARGPAMLQYVAEQYRPSAEAQAAGRQFHRDLFRRLAEAGVPLALGADSGGLLARDEVAYAVEIGGLTPAQALRAWAVETPRAIFPDRAIGRLADGFEASLLALACDPSVEFGCTGRILRREKQGVPIGPPAPRLVPSAGPTAYVGGQWWDGRAFAARDTVWSDGGVFVDGPLADVERVVDVGGRFVVPPFGDAHTHMLSDSYQGPGHAEMYVEDGAFYALVLTDRHSWAASVMDRFEGPGSVDVAYAHGGWTSPRSHPVQVYEWQALRYVGRELTDAMKRKIHESRLAENDAYFEAPTLADLDAKWATFLSHEPDVVKVYLMDLAGEREARSGMTGLAAGRGLTPEVLREVIRRAHAAGLRVFAHVETGADVTLAVESGVDGFAHLPGYGYGAGEDAPYLVADATVAAAGARGVVFVPTSVVGDSYNADRPARAVFGRDLHRRQLRELHAAGARIALGADRWNATSRIEADFFVEHGFFDRATVLDLWTRTTSQVVFPDRAIGELRAGFEASLLALACDPTADWSCTAQIAHREKQGLDLDLGGSAGRARR